MNKTRFDLDWDQQKAYIEREAITIARLIIWINISWNQEKNLETSCL